MIHPAAAVFSNHLLSGVAEENKVLQADISRLSPVREFVDSRGGLNWNKYDDLPATSEQQTRLAIVEALGGDTDHQMDLLGKNKRLKGELLRLKEIAEMIGAVEISNGCGETIKLSLRDGVMCDLEDDGEVVEGYAGSSWVIEKDAVIPFKDVASMKCRIGGAQLAPVLAVRSESRFMLLFTNGAVLNGTLVEDTGESSRKIINIDLSVPLSRLKHMLIAIGSMKATTPK